MEKEDFHQDSLTGNFKILVMRKRFLDVTYWWGKKKPDSVGKEREISIALDISTAIQEAERQWGNSFMVMRKRDFQFRMI